MPYTRKFDVFLHGAPVGGLYRQGRSLAFEFDEAYRDNPDRPVLGYRLDENIRTPLYAQDELPAWFANLLPEGPLRELLERSTDVDARLSRGDREIELLARVGTDLPGAVQVVHHGAGIEREFSVVEAASLAEDIDAQYEWRFSVAGVGLKLSMLRSGERFTSPVSGSKGDWLVKLPDRTFENLPVNEFAVMSLAREIGIDVPQIDLVHRDQLSPTQDSLWSGEELAFAIKRFDRTGEGRPVHIEDFAQIRGVRPERKYDGNFETVGNIAYRGQDERALLEFVRRLAFSILVGNGDAHLKNWSLIYPDRKNPTLSPAYDLVSVVAYAGRGIITSFALRLANRKQYEQVSLDAFARLARKVGSSLPLDEVAAAALTASREAWDILETSMKGSPAMAELIRHHAKEQYERLLGKPW